MRCRSTARSAARSNTQTLPDAMLSAHASLLPAGASLREIDLRLGGSSAQGELRWSRGTDDLRGMLNASVAVSDLGGLSSTEPARAAARRTPGGVGVAISARWRRPQATITASSDALDVAGQHFDRSAVEVSADLTRARFVFDRVTLQSGAGRIEGRGDVDFTRKTYTAHLTANDIPVHSGRRLHRFGLAHLRPPQRCLRRRRIVHQSRRQRTNRRWRTRAGRTQTSGTPLPTSGSKVATPSWRWTRPSWRSRATVRLASIRRGRWRFAASGRRTTSPRSSSGLPWRRPHRSTDQPGCGSS